jgi:hypothetical protein
MQSASRGWQAVFPLSAAFLRPINAIAFSEFFDAMSFLYQTFLEKSLHVIYFISHLINYSNEKLTSCFANLKGDLLLTSSCLSPASDD